MRVSAAVNRRLRCAAEGSLAQLEAAYNQLEDSEREKRAAGILKVRKEGSRERRRGRKGMQGGERREIAADALRLTLQTCTILSGAGTVSSW